MNAQFQKERLGVLLDLENSVGDLPSHEMPYETKKLFRAMLGEFRALVTEIEYLRAEVKDSKDHIEVLEDALRTGGSESAEPNLAAALRRQPHYLCESLWERIAAEAAISTGAGKADVDKPLHLILLVLIEKICCTEREARTAYRWLGDSTIERLTREMLMKKDGA